MYKYIMSLIYDNDFSVMAFKDIAAAQAFNNIHAFTSSFIFSKPKRQHIYFILFCVKKGIESKGL